MWAYSMGTGTSSYYRHQPYSANNFQSNVQSSQTSLCLLAPIPSAPLRSLHLMPTPLTKATMPSQRLHPLNPLSQMIATWNWHSRLLLQQVLKGR